MYEIYERLFARYGDPGWWPAQTPYEVIVGAVLTQNTAWVNVERAIENLGERLSPEFVAQAGYTELAEIIRPAGFFNQKTGYLKAVTAWYANYGYDTEAVRRRALAELRAELLNVRGVGPETADSILLYAFDFPTFVVDAYTIRLIGRYGVGDMSIVAGGDYEMVKAYFEDSLLQSPELYNRFHALIVTNAKEHCRKKPSCAGCPLEGDCRKRGLGQAPADTIGCNMKCLV